MRGLSHVVWVAGAAALALCGMYAKSAEAANCLGSTFCSATSGQFIQKVNVSCVSAAGWTSGGTSSDGNKYVAVQLTSAGSGKCIRGVGLNGSGTPISGCLAADLAADGTSVVAGGNGNPACNAAVAHRAEIREPAPE